MLAAGNAGRSKSLVESGVAELAADELAINPGFGLGGGGVLDPQ